MGFTHGGGSQPLSHTSFEPTGQLVTADSCTPGLVFVPAQPSGTPAMATMVIVSEAAASWLRRDRMVALNLNMALPPDTSTMQPRGRASDRSRARPGRDCAEPARPAIENECARPRARACAHMRAQS